MKKQVPLLMFFLLLTTNAFCTVLGKFVICPQQSEQVYGMSSQWNSIFKYVISVENGTIVSYTDETTASQAWLRYNQCRGQNVW